jgi:acetyltransferase-like isoleucine patch superfamily enzyme
MLIKKERIPILQLLFIGILPSPLKKMYYRMRGYRIGKQVKLSLGCVIIGKDVEIRDHVQIGFLTMVRGRTIHLGRFVKIGSMSVIDTEKIFIDEDARINEQVFIGGMKTPESALHLGKRTIVMQLSYLNPTLPITIGDDSGIGGHCLMFTHGSWNNQLEGFPVKFAPINLGKKVWLPWRVFVMPGTTVGDNVVIGANSLLQGEIPSNSLAAGNPAKVLRNDYPEVPDEAKKDKILKTIFEDFEKHLKYFEFNIEKTENTNGFAWKLTGQGKQSLLFFSKGEVPLDAIKLTDNVLVISGLSEEGMQQAKKAGWKMILALNQQKRLGSSNAGEEIATFFSRYGIRFGRMD